jgi:type II secretion system protein G
MFFAKKKKKKKRGFTLIELLVVIAIIGILATIVLVSLNTARAKARDARRSSDMHQIALAMEMFYDSNSSSYPNIDDTVATIPTTSTALSPYMTPLPVDPGSSAYKWTDSATPAGCYCAWATLEVPTTTTYVVSNKNGTKQTTTSPTVANCCAL